MPVLWLWGHIIMIMCLLCRIDSVNWWLEMALSLPYLGENCERVGISAQGIVNHSYQYLRLLKEWFLN